MGFRAGIVAVALAAAAALALASCGGGDGGESTTESEKAADVEYLNAWLGRELAIVDVYSRAIPRLPRPQVPAVQQLRSQALAHVDGVTKAIRGLGGEAEPEEVEVDYEEVASGTDFLELIYEMEGDAYVAYLDAAPLLATAAPRKLATALAASEAQHLMALRQLLGAGLAESFPEGFESGELPAPERAAESEPGERSGSVEPEPGGEG